MNIFFVPFFLFFRPSFQKDTSVTEKKNTV